MESQQAPQQFLQQVLSEAQQFEAQPVDPQPTEAHLAPLTDLALQNQPQEPNDDDAPMIQHEPHDIAAHFIVPHDIAPHDIAQHEPVQRTEHIENVIHDLMPMQHEPEAIRHEPEAIPEPQNIPQPMEPTEPTEASAVMDEALSLQQPPMEAPMEVPMEAPMDAPMESVIQPMETQQMEEEKHQMYHNEAQAFEAAQSPSLPPNIPQDEPQQGDAPEDKDSMMTDHVQQQERQQQQQQEQQQQHQEIVQETDESVMMHAQMIHAQMIHSQTEPKHQLPEPMETDDMESFSTSTNMNMNMNTNTSNNTNVDPKKEILIPELSLCETLLDEFMTRVETEPFNAPVDWKGLNLPDYPLIITKPMDLGTVAAKLECNSYSSADQFAADVRLVFRNAKTYNMVGSGIYLVADSLLKQFERRYARITKNVSHRKRKSMDKIKNGEESTYKERETFTTMIQQLTPSELGGVVEIIDKKCPMALNDSYGEDGVEDEMEIEVYHINGSTLRDLILYIEKTITKRAKKKKKQEYY